MKVTGIVVIALVLLVIVSVAVKFEEKVYDHCLDKGNSLLWCMVTIKYQRAEYLLTDK